MCLSQQLRALLIIKLLDLVYEVDGVLSSERWKASSHQMYHPTVQS